MHAEVTPTTIAAQYALPGIAAPSTGRGTLSAQPEMKRGWRSHRFNERSPAVAALLKIAERDSRNGRIELWHRRQSQPTSAATTLSPYTRQLDPSITETLADTQLDTMNSSEPWPVISGLKPVKKIGFLDLPAEIRNTIYELIYADDSSNDKKRPVRVIEACPPSKNLRLACKQISKEAWPFYRQAYQHYWMTSSFHITWASDRRVGPRGCFKNDDLARIRKLTMVTTWRNLKSRVATNEQERWLSGLSPGNDYPVWFDYHEDGKWVSRDSFRGSQILPGHRSWKVVVLGITHSAVVSITITGSSTVHLYRGACRLTVGQLKAL